jgi:hypothetical protein
MMTQTDPHAYYLYCNDVYYYLYLYKYTEGIQVLLVQCSSTILQYKYLYLYLYVFLDDQNAMLSQQAMLRSAGVAARVYYARSRACSIRFIRFHIPMNDEARVNAEASTPSAS